MLTIAAIGLVGTTFAQTPDYGERVATVETKMQIVLDQMKEIRSKQETIQWLLLAVVGSVWGGPGIKKAISKLGGGAQ